MYFFLGLAAIGGVAWYMWPITSSNTDNFVRTSGVLATLIVGIMTSHMTRLNARLQTDALAEVEDIKLYNAAHLSSIQGNITVVVHQATKTFEVNLLKSLEEQKATYTGRIQ